MKRVSRKRQMALEILEAGHNKCLYGNCKLKFTGYVISSEIGMPGRSQKWYYCNMHGAVFNRQFRKIKMVKVKDK